MNLSLNNHWMRKALQLSLNEMAVLCEIYSLSNNTDYHGWCFKSKHKIGETLDLSKATVIAICNTLEVKGYINKHPETKFLQPTKWIRHVAQEQDNFAFMVESDGFVLASAKMQEIIEEKMGRSESLQSVRNFTESVKKIDQSGKESLPKYNNSNTYSTPKEIYKEKFEIFRKEYKGTKRGLDEEFKTLQKHKDWKEVCDVILENYKHQLALRELKQKKGEFVPSPKNLKTYLNNRCWTEDMDKDAQIGLTDEEKGRLQRLDQYFHFDGKDYLVKHGLWEEYQDLKTRYAANSNK